MRFFAFALTTIIVGYASAAPANPAGHVYTQPDGTLTPSIFLQGDEHYAWLSDAKGYTVIKDDQGWYVYAKTQDDGDLVSANVRVGYANPKKLGLVPQLQHDEALRRGLDDENKESRKLIAVPEKTLCNFNGNKTNPCRLKGLVVLSRFTNHESRILPSPSEYDILFNNNGPTSDTTAPSGSVADVYLENSYDTFVMEAVVSDWIPLTKSEADAVDGNMGLNMPGTRAAWQEALTLARPQFVSYKQFDGDGDGYFDLLVMVHSGTAAETGGIDTETGGDFHTRIWSHATTSAWYSDADITVGRFYVASGLWDIKPPGGAFTKWGIARIAVIAHECAHFLGLPDLYDTTGGSGVGTFDLMGVCIMVALSMLQYCCYCAVSLLTKN
jgi:immune inhibitor A